MKSLKQENELLKQRLAEAELKINELTELVSELKNDFAFKLYQAIVRITKDDFEILNPEPVIIKSAHKSKHEEFRLKVTDILYITCVGKVKTIKLNTSIENFKGKYRETDTITVDSNDSLEKFRHGIDSISYHLIQVNRNTVVNLKYFALKGETLVCTFENDKTREPIKFEISKSHVDDFVVRKQMFDELISLQKTLLRYIG